MAFMQKDTVKKYAKMYGIDLTGKTWAEQNQAFVPTPVKEWPPVDFRRISDELQS